MLAKMREVRKRLTDASKQMEASAGLALALHREGKLGEYRMAEARYLDAKARVEAATRELEPLDAQLP